MISLEQITPEEEPGEKDWMELSYAYFRSPALDISMSRPPGSKAEGLLGPSSLF